jgi:CRP-like cAMP-binding protein
MDEVHRMKVLKERVSALSFFRGMQPDHVCKLTDSAMGTVFEPGQSIFLAGEEADRFYIIEEGRAAIDTPGPSGCSIPIQVLNPGDVIGWSWLYPPHKWNLSAHAVDRCEAVSFFGTHVLLECKKDIGLGNDLYQRISQVMLDRLHHILDRLVEVSADK